MPSDHSTTSPLLSNDEARRLCGLSRSTWLRLRAAGLGPPSVEVPGLARPRYFRRDVEAWLRANQN